MVYPSSTYPSYLKSHRKIVLAAPADEPTNCFWRSCSFRTVCMGCIFYLIQTTFEFFTSPCDR
jgi:hypothetical protein